MLNKSNIIIYLIFLFSYQGNGYSDNCIDKTIKIYSDIINSIGVSFPLPPELIFSDSQNNPAYISNKGIVIEKKLIELFCQDENFDSQIAYVISHELAHHYLNHMWMKNSGFGYSSSIGNYIYDQSRDKNQRKLAESQADLFGGFYGQISGYDVLSNAESSLIKIYEEYNIPKEIEGYPSLSERIEIINSNIESAETLEEFFHLGNVLMKGNFYNEAKESYELILKNNFNSREILNNLALVYLKFGISISEEKISKLIYPLYIDNNTRLSTERTRSGSFSNDTKELFKKSISLFETALSFDSNYLPAKQNLFVARYLESNEDRRYRVLEDIEDSELSDSIKTDFVVIDMIMNNEKYKKIAKLASCGSSFSKMNLDDDKKGNTYFSDIDILDDIGIDNSEYIFGFRRPFKRLKSSTSSLQIKRKTFGDNILYDFDNLLILKSRNSEFGNTISYNDNYYYIFNKD
tara:strand:+ start:2552 stop:3940 length:1389 start_codon:yes stop_codon:yes gene_type:complete